VECSCAAGRHWGTHGAAGLLIYDPGRDAVLLQLRGARAHEGGTWGTIGGACHPGESARAAALREAWEEARIAPQDLEPVWWSTATHGPWHYTTVTARTVGGAFAAPEPDGHESDAHRWVPTGDVASLPLHPGFAESWPRLAPRLNARLTLIVDVANVMGSVNDGWYRDRLAAARRWYARLVPLAAEGVPGRTVGWPEFDGFYPQLVLVVEGQAGDLAAEVASGPEPPGVAVVRSPRDGDSQIVEEVRAGIVRGDIAVAVTADRELADAVRQAGGETIRPGALKRLLGFERDK
jgi:8-oxo-dGTP pyrophosphatase MutT (NUDIX family)